MKISLLTLLICLMFKCNFSFAQLNRDSLILALNSKIEINKDYIVKVKPINKLNKSRVKISAILYDKERISANLCRKVKITKSGTKLENVVFQDPLNKIKAFFVNGEIDHFRWTKLDTKDEIIYVRNLLLKHNQTILSLK